MEIWTPRGRAASVQADEAERTMRARVRGREGDVEFFLIGRRGRAMIVKYQRRFVSLCFIM
jgi:hypothetical protein